MIFTESKSNLNIHILIITRVIMMVKTKKIGAILARVVLIGSAVAAAYEKSIDAAACEKSNQAKKICEWPATPWNIIIINFSVLLITFFFPDFSLTLLILASKVFLVITCGIR